MKTIKTPKERPLRIAQYICSSGFYGAEKWILALADNSDVGLVSHELLLTPDVAEEMLLGSKFKEIGLPVVSVPMQGRFDPFVVKKITRYIKENQIDVIHTHGYKSDILGLIAAKLSGIKSVCTPHGFENSKDIKLRLFIGFGCQFFRFFDLVVPLSQDLYNVVQRYGVSDKKLRMIENGVNLKEIDHVIEKNVNQNTHSTETGETFTLGFVGQMIERKNIKDLIFVFAKLHEKYSNTRLLLVGDGSSINELKSLVEKAGIEDSVEFSGFVSDAINYYSKLDMFVMTSSLEGIPRSMMEAMAFKVPVVAYNIPGVSSLVRNSETGILVPFGDTEKLFLETERIMLDKIARTSHSKMARKLIEEKYSAKRMAEEYSALYRGLIKV